MSALRIIIREKPGRGRAKTPFVAYPLLPVSYGIPLRVESDTRSFMVQADGRGLVVEKDPRSFVVERDGRIRTIEADARIFRISRNSN